MGRKSKRARHWLAAEPCHYCGDKATTFDHIVPRALNGPNLPFNKVPSCFACNQAKADKYPTCMCQRCNNARGLSFLALSEPKYEKNPDLVQLSKQALHTDFQPGDSSMWTRLY